MDLVGFYATVSATGFTLLGLWWVVVDKHPDWFEERDSARMAYLVSLQFMIPATSSLLSLVAPDSSVLWRLVFAALGLTGVAGAVLVSRVATTPGSVSVGALLVGLPVYVLVVVVAVFPGIGSPIGATGLQVEAFLTAVILLLALHAVWFFSRATDQVGSRS